MPPTLLAILGCGAPTTAPPPLTSPPPPPVRCATRDAWEGLFGHDDEGFAFWPDDPGTGTEAPRWSPDLTLCVDPACARANAFMNPVRVRVLGSQRTIPHDQQPLVQVCHMLAYPSDQPWEPWSGCGTMSAGFEESSFLADSDTEAWWLEFHAEGRASGCQPPGITEGWGERRVFVTGRLRSVGGYGHLNAYGRQLDCLTMVPANTQCAGQ